MTPTVEDTIQIAYQMFWVIFLLSMPMLLTALVVGVMISLFQTVTGVQEMTLTFVPKLLAVLAAVAVALPWMSTIMLEYTRTCLQQMAGLLP